TLLVRYYSYCLVLRFENLDMLKEYYAHPRHSRARERIFRAFKPRDSVDYSSLMNDLYDMARDDSKNTTTIYQAIESLASRYILRADLVEQTDLDIIVKGPSKRFNLNSEDPKPSLTLN